MFRLGEREIYFVIPGRRTRVRAKRGPVGGEPGIHNHDREYGFRARAKGRVPE
jgi:hypothetical protein